MRGGAEGDAEVVGVVPAAVGHKETPVVGRPAADYSVGGAEAGTPRPRPRSYRNLPTCHGRPS